MTYLGTRPILPDELEQYELHHRARIAIKPGITGMWQVSGRSDITDFEEIVRLDTEYISEKILSQEGAATRLSEFVNRTKEIGDIEESIRAGYKLIILQGILGIGKSSLAEKAIMWLYPNKAI